jgi:hypothetical protein
MTRIGSGLALAVLAGLTAIGAQACSPQRSPTPATSVASASPTASPSSAAPSSTLAASAAACLTPASEPAPSFATVVGRPPDLVVRIGTQVLRAPPVAFQEGPRDNEFGWFEGGSGLDVDTAVAQAPVIEGRAQTEGEGTTERWDFDLATMEVPAGLRLTWRGASVNSLCRGTEAALNGGHPLIGGTWSYPDVLNVAHNALTGLSEIFLAGERDYIAWLTFEIDPVGSHSGNVVRAVYAVRYRVALDAFVPWTSAPHER